MLSTRFVGQKHPPEFPSHDSDRSRRRIASPFASRAVLPVLCLVGLQFVGLQSACMTVGKPEAEETLTFGVDKSKKPKKSGAQKKGEDAKEESEGATSSETEDSTSDAKGSKGDSEKGSSGKGKSDKSDDNEDPGDDASSSGDQKFDLGAVPDFEHPDPPCDIDFLFVIDNSKSMKDEQGNLADSVPKFVHTLQKEIKDLENYQVGVIVTDDNRQNDKPCQKMGALVTKTGGAASSNKKCGPYAKGHNFMTNEDDLGEAFACAAKPGVGGSGAERPMDALREALDAKILAKGECNAGFLREDALLVVTLITDEEDDRPEGGTPGSKDDPPKWYKDVIAVKGDDPRKVVFLGLIGTSTSDCDPLVGPEVEIGEQGAQISERLESFVKMFGSRGVVGDVCASQYDVFFKKAVSTIHFACEEFPQG